MELKSGEGTVVVADRDQNIIQSVVAALKTTPNPGLIRAGNLKERSASYGVYSFLRFNT